MVSLRSRTQPGRDAARRLDRWNPAPLLIVAVASVLVAAVSGLAFGVTISLLLHLPKPTSVPDCPAGTTLYTRTVLLGKALVPIQHCFRETDAQDPRA
jgi:hypothetical protein